MGRIKSAIIGAVGTGILLYTSCGIKNRYSNENIWSRMRPKIERAYKVDFRRAAMDLGKTRKKGKRLSFSERRRTALRMAKELRDKRYERLRADLRKFDEEGASREKRCMYETRESAKLVLGSKADSALKNRSFEPGAECKTSKEYKKPLNLLGLIGGGLLALYGVLTLVLSFRRRREEYNPGMQ